MSNHIKKPLAAMLLLAAILTLTACKTTPAPTTPSNTDPQAQVSATDSEITAHDLTFESRKEAYYCVLNDMLERGRFPDGDFAGCSFIGDKMSDNEFAVCDVDEDGQEELVIVFTTSITAGMQARVYDFDEDTGRLVEQWIAGCSTRFFENGFVMEDSSRNGSGGSLWPYRLYRYDGSDYDYIAWVYSRYSEFCEGEGYRYEEDTSGTGTVYFIDDAPEGSDYEPPPVDVTEYESWLEGVMDGSEEIVLEYYPLTKENNDKVNG